VESFEAGGEEDTVGLLVPGPSNVWNLTAGPWCGDSTQLRFEERFSVREAAQGNRVRVILGAFYVWGKSVRDVSGKDHLSLLQTEPT